MNIFKDTFIIAEIGHNHMGQLDTCKDLFREAKRVGASAVKLQKRSNKTLFTKAAYNRPYQNRNSYGETYGLHREALEFGWPEYVELMQYADELNIIFFSTPFDFESVDFLERLDVPLYKIASADCTNIPLIKYVVQTGKPVIISTGGATWEDIDRVYEVVDKPKTAFLHCVTTYPNQPDEMNLQVIPEMKNRYPKLAAVGLSDHYNGICMAETAYVLGARVIEKHFTLNHSWKGTDHALSLEPQGMESLVNNIKRISIAMGKAEKIVLEQEKSAIEKMGKSIWPARSIKAGEVLTEENLSLKTPAGGMPPYLIEEVVGKITLNDLSTDTPLGAEDIEYQAWGVGGWPI